MSMFLYGAFAGVLCGGFIGCLAMALVQVNRRDDIGTGTEFPAVPVSRLDRGWTYPRDDVRERYESECG